MLKDEINRRVASLKKNNESDSAFARRCGISQTTMSGYLGNRSVPKVEALKKIADANEKSLDWLISDKKPQAQEKELARFSNPLLEELEGWLMERQDSFSADQFMWFKGDLEERYPEFRDWLKKRTNTDYESKTGTTD